MSHFTHCSLLPGSEGGIDGSLHDKFQPFGVLAVAVSH